MEAAEVLKEWSRDPEIGAIVVTGSGRAFCAGGDVSMMAREDDASTLEQKIDGLRDMQEISWLLYSSPKVTIASVNGFAMGAGLGIALSCDLRIASSAAKFGTAYAKVGYGGDFGTTWLLTHYAGAPKAKELFFLADPIDAAEAHRIGLVNRVVEPEVAGRRNHIDRIAYRPRPAHQLPVYEAKRKPGRDRRFPHAA